MVLELDLNRLGSEKLNGFGLNGSVAGNLRELKFEENGISLKLGDKQFGKLLRTKAALAFCDGF